MFADPVFVAVRPEVLRELVPRMKALTEKFRKKHKIWPHPAQVYHMAVSEKEAEQKKQKKQERAKKRKL